MAHGPAGHIVVVVEQRATVTIAPTLPLPPPRVPRRTLPRIRTRNVSPTPPQFNPPVPLRPVRPTRQMRGMPVRRGHMAVPVPPQFNPPSPPPHPTQHRVWPSLFRRGRAVSPIPAQQALPTNPPYATVGDQHRLWAGWLRRGRRITPVPPQANPPLPLPPPQRRRVAPLMRRGGRSVSVPTQDVLRPLGRSRRAVPGRRSRQPLSVPAPAVVVPNPALPTKTATIRRLAGWLLRRNRKAERGWPQGVNLVIPDITYPTAFEVLANWHLDVELGASEATIELTSSNLEVDVDVGGTTFAVDPSSLPFDLD